MLVKQEGCFISCPSISGIISGKSFSLFSQQESEKLYLYNHICISQYQDNYICKMPGRQVYFELNSMLVVQICLSFKAYFPVKLSLFWCPKSSFTNHYFT